MMGVTRPLLLLFAVTQASHAIKVQPKAAVVDDDGCRSQVVLLEEESAITAA